MLCWTARRARDSSLRDRRATPLRTSTLVSRRQPLPATSWVCAGLPALACMVLVQEKSCCALRRSRNATCIDRNKIFAHSKRATRFNATAESRAVRGGWPSGPRVCRSLYFLPAPARAPYCISQAAFYRARVREQGRGTRVRYTSIGVVL
jgi:hypothetical protein